LCLRGDLAGNAGVVADLQRQGIAFRDFFQQPTNVPSVFGFIPQHRSTSTIPMAALELLAPIPVAPRPDLGIVSWTEWVHIVGGAA
jgi:hypothetical protein